MGGKAVNVPNVGKGRIQRFRIEAVGEGGITLGLSP